MKLRRVLLAVTAFVLIASAAPAQTAPPATETIELPAPTGPYKVGTTTWHVTDAARSRQVEVLAWYPAAAPGEAGKTAPYLREGLAELPPRLRTAFSSLADLKTHAILDAPAVAEPKKLPVLVFSHGLGGIPSSYTALLEDLASHGYAVLSVIHPEEATAATLADGKVVSMFDESGKPRPAFNEVIAEWAREDEIMASVTREAKEADQVRLLREYLSGLRATNATLDRWVKDTKAVLDRLPADGPLTSRLDLDRLGAFGHSMGGVTSGQFCLEDRRCRAGLNLDGIPQYGTMIDKKLSQPFLMVYSARPGRAGASDAIYRRAASRYYRVDVQNTLHLDFSDMILWGGPLRSGALGTLAPARAVEITRTVVREFFDQELLGKASPVLSGKVTLPEVAVKRFP